MKKFIFTTACLALFASAFAQTQRLVLFEEFTQASCGPCASQNPAFNALIAQNETKTITIKYQTSWPGVDPMNIQTASEVATRVSYYGVTGVPYTRGDGTLEPTGPQAYAGAPFNVDQGLIDSLYAVPAPMSINISHTLSANLDTISITCTIVNVSGGAIAAGAAGSLKAHVVIVEEELNFPTPPGSNGEMDFYSVMRKMLPGDAGTTMSDNIPNGDTLVLTFTEALPSYIYDYSQIGVVAFVQDDNSQQVHQAAYSAPVAVTNIPDAGIASNTTTGGYCVNTVTPTFTLSNDGTTPITSATVGYTIDTGTAVTQNWTGNLAAGATASVAFPQITLTAGASYEFTGSVSNVNGGVDYNTLNDNALPFDVSIISAATTPSPREVTGFEHVALGSLPSNVILEDQTGRVYVVDQTVNTQLTQRLGGFTYSNSSIRWDFWTISQVGEVSSIISDKVDLTNGTNSVITFARAHAQYQTSADRLQVFVSDDCGANWTQVYDRAGADLATTSPQNSARFYPQAYNEWNLDTADISAFDGSSEVIIRFSGTSDYGNSLYVDDIKVNDVALVGIEESALEGELKLFPNPAKDQFNVTFELASTENVSIELYDYAGRVVYTNELGSLTAGAHSTTIRTAQFEKGVYLANIKIGDELITKRFSIVE